MIRQLQRQGPVFWNEALRGIQPEYCINMMYTPHKKYRKQLVFGTFFYIFDAKKLEVSKC